MDLSLLPTVTAANRLYTLQISLLTSSTAASSSLAPLTLVSSPTATYPQQQISSPSSISLRKSNPSSPSSISTSSPSLLFANSSSAGENKLWPTDHMQCYNSYAARKNDNSKYRSLSEQTTADLPLPQTDNKPATSTIVYRPTPIRPTAFALSSAVSSNSLKYYDSSLITGELPLDLSFNAKTDAINEKNDALDAAATKVELVKQQSSNLLPTCLNFNSKWITSKLSTNRMSYPREFKLLVISYYQKHGQNKYRTCKEFQITKSMLNGWLQKMENIIQSRPGSLKSGRSGRKPQFPDIERQLFSLYCKRLASGEKTSNKWFRDTAKNLAQKQCTKQELAGMCRFSERWLSNFKKRYHINLHRKWSSDSISICSLETVSSDSSSLKCIKQAATAKNKIIVDCDSSETNDISNDYDYRCNSESSEAFADGDLQSVPDELEVFDHGKVAEVLNKPGQLPILTFYERFPWLCKKNSGNSNGEPGKRGRKVQFPNVERILFDRFQAKRISGEHVSNRWLQEQARELATKLCPEIFQDAKKTSRCFFSEHWLHNFKKRYAVTLKSSLATACTLLSEKNRKLERS